MVGIDRVDARRSSRRSLKPLLAQHRGRIGGCQKADFSVASGDAIVLQVHFPRERLCGLVIARPFAAAPDPDQAIGAAPPTARVLTGSLNLRRTLLRTGRFVTVMPHSLPRFGPDQEWVKVLPIDLPTWTVPTMLITLRNRTLSPVAERLAEHTRVLARSLAAG
ncbi:hypothetical protein OEJ37_19730 [Burkholderia sp. BKH01]|nr:hypothetical protein [Burkholderia sp. BKH01]